MTQTIQERTDELVEDYTKALGEFVEERVPVVLVNREYAARSAALMIALGRQLARVAVAFGEVHEVEPQHVSELVLKAFVKNHLLALDAVRTAESIQ